VPYISPDPVHNQFHYKHKLPDQTHVPRLSSTLALASERKEARQPLAPRPILAVRRTVTQKASKNRSSPSLNCRAANRTNKVGPRSSIAPSPSGSAHLASEAPPATTSPAARDFGYYCRSWGQRFRNRPTGQSVSALPESAAPWPPPLLTVVC
jgi:hypothetical protein